MGWPKRKREPAPPSALDAGFSTSTEPTWTFDTAHLSPTLCEFVRAFARTGNQEPCNEEELVQQLAQGEHPKDQDTRRLAIRARIAMSGHEGPWSRDEVAGFVAAACVGSRRLVREKLAREGRVLGRWSGDELGTVDHVPWPPKVGFGG